MATVERRKNDNTPYGPIKRVKNLLWLLRQAGKGNIEQLEVWAYSKDGSFMLTAYTRRDKYGEYSIYQTSYASWEVFLGWLSRSRVLRGERVRVGAEFPLPRGDYEVSRDGLTHKGK